MRITFGILICISSLLVSLYGQNTEAIPFKVERNRTLISVKMGNKIIPDILLDTGFGFDGLMIYNPAYLDSFDLDNAKKIKVGGAGDGASAKAFLEDSIQLSIGGLDLVNQSLIVIEDTLFKDFPSNGIIGYALFGHFVCALDYDVKFMFLHDPGTFSIGKGWSEFPLYFKGNKIPWMDIAISIDGEDPIKISTYIDFGAGDKIVLLKKSDMKFALPQDTRKKYIGRGLSGDIYGEEGNISRLIIGAREVKNINASIADAKVRSKQDNADAILGCGLLRKFNLIFDYQEKRLFAKPNSYFYESQKK